MFKNRKRGGLPRIDDWFRSMVIRRIGVGTSLVPGDLEIASRMYGFRGTRFGAFYPNVVNYTRAPLSDDIVMANSFPKKTIMVGNSADPTNRHIAVLRALHAIWDGSFSVYLPLAYGDSEYADLVIALARDLFGNNANVQRTFLAPDEYSRVLEAVDVAIYNHNRQQALGNILYLLSIGKKVYLRSDTTTFAFFQDNGIEVYPTEHLLEGKHSLAELLDIKDRTNVFDRVFGLVSDQRAEHEWRNIFKNMTKKRNRRVANPHRPK